MPAPHDEDALPMPLTHVGFARLIRSGSGESIPFI
jgi:hypothetical protein